MADIGSIKKDIDDVAEGFWAKHCYCVIGTTVALVAGFVLGLLV